LKQKKTAPPAEPSFKIDELTMTLFVAAAALIKVAHPPVTVTNLFMSTNACASKPENGPDKDA